MRKAPLPVLITLAASQWLAAASIFTDKNESFSGRIFVRQNASGTANGTTWADAFPNLQVALASAQAGDEIWVAEGTYRPDTATSSFSIGGELKLYGGFAGTETSLAERDPALHPTVLSGDLNGDDIPGDFSQNRADNATHVVWVDGTTTLNALLDGFVIRGGHADDLQQQEGGSGGGMICFGKPLIRGCVFEQNYAVSGGGGLYLFHPSPGTVHNCLFSGNMTLGAGAGLYVLRPANLLMADCTFEKNMAADGGGASIFLAETNAQVALARCNFIGNEATTSSGGAGIFVNSGADNAQIKVDSCHFMLNKCQADGGGLTLGCMAKNLTFALRRCFFNQNNADEAGGAAYCWGQGGATGTVALDSCGFDNNTSLSSGGLELGNSQNGTNLIYRLSDCLIENNHAVEGGGLTLWSTVNAKASFSLDNCQILKNKADKKGGGLVLLPSSKDFRATLRRCEIVQNRCLAGGAAVYAHQYLPNVPLPTTASAVFENCLIARNGGLAAVMTLDSLPNLTLRHCTLASNGDGGIGIGQTVHLTLQNTLFFNNANDNPEILAENPSQITSLGGNLIGDGSLGTAASPYDLQNTDPLFPVPFVDFHLSDNSPALDKGVDLGNLPATDLDGNPRVNACPDIGAYESATVVSTDCVVSFGEALAADAALKISPNPAGSFLQIRAADGQCRWQAQVFDAQGRSLRRFEFSGNGELDIRDWPPGIYVLRAVCRADFLVVKFLKQSPGQF